MLPETRSLVAGLTWPALRADLAVDNGAMPYCQRFAIRGK